MSAGAFMPKPSGSHGGLRTGSPTRTWVAEPPPFGVSGDRFSSPKDDSKPGYHVAYRDIMQPPRWTAKGWVGIDDTIKGRRGTSPSAYGTSSLIRPTDAPKPHSHMAPLRPPVPNETRLQELLELQRRKLHTDPGPGTYNAPKPPPRRRFRRPIDPTTDGPFYLSEGDQSTRVKEISALIRNEGDSGLGPGAYDGLISKDALCKSSPAAKIGTTDRSGRTQHAKSLSVSRSIQHGIDWHVPVIVQAPPQGAGTPLTSRDPHSPSAAAAAAAAAASSSHRSGDAPPRIYSDADAHGSAAQRRDGSRDTSPSGRPPAAAALAEQMLGAPPPPPKPVARSLRSKELGKSPGNWDWNRLDYNYRNNWTTLHGGAYTHGEARLARRSNSAPVAVPQEPPQQLHHPDHAEPGVIFPIPEENSAAYSTSQAGDQPPQELPYQEQEQQYSQYMQYEQQHQQQYVLGPQPPSDMGATASSYAGGFGAGGAPPDPAALERAGVIREQDLARRRAAAAAASHAKQASQRLAEWHEKYSR